jgi:hypothetical protein
MLWLLMAVVLGALGGAVSGGLLVGLVVAWAGTEESTAKRLRDGAILLGTVLGMLVTVYVWALGLAIRLVPVTVSMR